MRIAVCTPANISVKLNHVRPKPRRALTID